MNILFLHILHLVITKLIFQKKQRKGGIIILCYGVKKNLIILIKLNFGFKFQDIEKYLDKCINYLNIIYKDIINMIYSYKQELAKQKIIKKENPIEQLNILLYEDKNRLNERYKYEIDKIKVLIETPITDFNNEIAYKKYRNLLINKIQYLYNAIQYPNNVRNIKEIEDIIYCKTETLPKNQAIIIQNYLNTVIMKIWKKY